MQIDIFFAIFTNPLFWLSLLFWAFIFVLFILLARFKKTKAISLIFPVLAMVKTRRLNNFIRRVAMLSPRGWKIFFNIGIFVSFFFMVYGFYFFTNNLFTLLLNIEEPPPEAALTPLLPGVTISFDTFIYLIIPILFILTVHELAHGISANADGIPVKSTGILGMGLFFIFAFGAFVEPDERAYRKRMHPRMARLRLAAAGSFTNAILAVFAILITINFTSFVSLSWGAPDGLQIMSVTPAAEGGHNEGILQVGDVLRELNGTHVPRDVSLSSYLYYNVTQNATLECVITRNGANMTLTVFTGLPPSTHQNQSIAFIGIQSMTWWPPKDWFGTLMGGLFPNTLQVEFLWLYIISISVTMFNMMPLPIFDGDKCVYEVIDALIPPKKEKKSLSESIRITKDFKQAELREVFVEQIEKIDLVRNDDRGNEVSEPLEPFKDYQPIDADGDGMIDHVSFELRDQPLPKDAWLDIRYQAEVDATKAKKDLIMNAIRVVALALVLGNFILSFIAFGFNIPFLS